jgi:hypothetical protein
LEPGTFLALLRHGLRATNLQRPYITFVWQ